MSGRVGDDCTGIGQNDEESQDDGDKGPLDDHLGGGHVDKDGDNGEKEDEDQQDGDISHNSRLGTSARELQRQETPAASTLACRFGTNDKHDGNRSLVWVSSDGSPLSSLSSTPSLEVVLSVPALF